LSTSEWNFVAFSNGFADTGSVYAMHNSMATEKGGQLPNNIGEALFEAIEVCAC
jgi:hypothetical protein